MSILDRWRGSQPSLSYTSRKRCRQDARSSSRLTYSTRPCAHEKPSQSRPSASAITSSIRPNDLPALDGPASSILASRLSFLDNQITKRTDDAFICKILDRYSWYFSGNMLESHRQSVFRILTAYSGQEALQKAGNNPDLILLDINMPDIDGLTVCQKIRDYITCPILFLTARIESGDKIIGFQAGADDYIVKPFDLDELGARIAAHLRREQRRQSNSAVRFFGELALDYSARTATINSQSIPLSKREFEIVELLSLNAGQVFDRERIYELVWGLDGDGNSDTIMEHIRKIRAKFAAHTLHNYIETVWGCGYRWNA